MLAKDYFQCRMDRGLMDREEWPKLGYKDLDSNDEKNAIAKATEEARKGPRN